MSQSDREISRLLGAWSDGDLAARDRLMPLVFEELRQIARHQFGQEHAGHTLQPTAVVNELYMRLAAQHRVQWRHRPEFFAVASRLIRRILVDHARRRQAAKRGAGERPVALAADLGVPVIEDPALLALDEALVDLLRKDPRGGRVVELHVFGGLTFDEIADVLDIGRATVVRDWRHARLWLRRRLEGELS